jgi:hypothetical protein
MAGLSGKLRIQTCNDEESVCCKNVFEHLAIARLENMKRHERLRKERHVRQRHDGQLFRQGDIQFHFSISVAACGKTSIALPREIRFRTATAVSRSRF